MGATQTPGISDHSTLRWSGLARCEDRSGALDFLVNGGDSMDVAGIEIAASHPKSDVAKRHLDAAESLFFRLGYSGTSMRAVAARARVSLGTVVYHWGTKENLFRQVCLRRFEAIIAEQLRLLRRCEEQWSGDPRRDIEAVLRALVEPPLLAYDDPHEAETTRQLYGRVLTDPAPEVLRVTSELFTRASNLYRELIRRALPSLSDEDFYWRHTCALGAFIFAQSFGYRTAYATGIEDLSSNRGQAVQHIVASMLSVLRNGG
jgi:AcrR family transcriptional regulator